MYELNVWPRRNFKPNLAMAVKCLDNFPLNTESILLSVFFENILIIFKENGIKIMIVSKIIDIILKV